jgi:hypothetical protein
MKTDYENGALPQTPQGMLHPLTLLKPVAAESGNRQIGVQGNDFPCTPEAYFSIHSIALAAGPSFIAFHRNL